MVVVVYVASESCSYSRNNEDWLHVIFSADCVCVFVCVCVCLCLFFQLTSVSLVADLILFQIFGVVFCLNISWQHLLSFHRRYRRAFWPNYSIA